MEQIQSRRLLYLLNTNPLVSKSTNKGKLTDKTTKEIVDLSCDEMPNFLVLKCQRNLMNSETINKRDLKKIKTMNLDTS